jgi:hypothetical protein
VNVSELKARLSVAQDELVEAMQAGDFELLAELMAERQVMIEELVELGSANPTLKQWVQDFLARDREIQAEVIVHRDKVTAEMVLSRANRQAHLTYLRNEIPD